MASYTIYPPLVESYGTPILSGSEVKIYFAFSPYNQPNEVHTCALVNLNNMNTGRSLLKDKDGKSSECVAFVWQYDTIISQYYIEIPTSFFSALTPGLYYQAQIRLLDKTISGIVHGSSISLAFINSNASLISDFSGSIIMPCIEKPEIKFFAQDNQDLYTLVSLTNFTIQYSNSLQSEMLDSYKVSILVDENNDGQFSTSYSVYNSDWTDTNNNIVNIKTPIQVINNQYYKVRFDYITVSGYVNRSEASVLINTGLAGDSGLVLELASNNDYSYIKIDVSRASTDALNTTMIVRRSSYKSNFTLWETLDTLRINGSIKYNYFDYTAEAGTWYKYEIQLGSYLPVVSEPIMVEFEDIFLLNNKGIFVVRLNPTISNYKITTQDSITTTLGGKYPVIRRNGDNYYRSFSIGGLISCLGDPEEYEFSADSANVTYEHYRSSLFLNKSDAFGLAYSAQMAYNEANRINDYNDFVFERLFREKALEFLNDGKVKLFKSLAEGNMLVSLTNVSLTPNQQLGRRVYSFTATATEVADPTVENFEKYNINYDIVNSRNSYLLKSTSDGYDESTGTLYVSYESILEDVNNGEEANTLIVNEDTVSVEG